MAISADPPGTSSTSNGRIPTLPSTMSRKSSSSKVVTAESADNGNPIIPIVSSDEINILIYTYLCESHFVHTAYNFRNEAKLDRSPLFQYLNPDPSLHEFNSSSSAHPHSAANPKAYSNMPANGLSEPPTKARKGKGRDLMTTIPPPSANGEGSTTSGAAAEEEKEKAVLERRIRRGLLVEYLQRGLMHHEITTHYGADGKKIECRQPFSLVRPHSCSVQPIPIDNFLTDYDPSTLLSDEEDGPTPQRRQDIFPPPPLRMKIPVSRNDPKTAKPPGPRSTSEATSSKPEEEEDIDMEGSTTPTASVKISVEEKPKAKSKVQETDGEESEGASVKIKKKSNLAPGRPSKHRDTDNAPSPGASSNGTSRSGNTKATTRSKVRMVDVTDDDQDDDQPPVMKKRKTASANQMPAPDVEITGKGKGKATPKGSAKQLPDSEDDIAENKKASNRSRRNSNASSSVRASEKAASPPPKASTAAASKNPLIPIKSENGVVSWKWRQQSKQIFHVVWNPANVNRLASCSGDGTALVWDFEEQNEGNLTALVNPPALCSHKSVEKAKPVLDLAFSPDGNLLSTVCADGIARTFFGDGEMYNINTRHTGELLTLAFSETENYLATAGLDGAINVWQANVEGTRMLMSVSPHTQEIFYVDWLDSDVFAACSADHNVSVNRVQMPGTSKLLKGHTDRILMLKFSPKGGPAGTQRLLASASDDKTVRIWDVDAVLADLEATAKAGTGKASASSVVKAEDGSDPLLFRKLLGHTDDVVFVQWHPEVVGVGGRRLLLTSSRADDSSKSEFGHVIKLFDVSTGQCLYTITRHTDIINALDFSPAGKLFASCSDDHLLLIWNTETGKLVKQFDLGAGCNDVKWRKDGQQVALAMQDRTVRTVYVGNLVEGEKEILKKKEEASKSN